jgi:cell division protein FtsL
MSRLSITRSSTISLGKNRRGFSSRLKSGPVTMVMVVIFLICVLSLFFLAQVFQSSTKGYEITELHNQIKNLEEQNKSLEIEAAELKSFENLKNEADTLNMVGTNNIVYIKRSGTSVAVANQ